MLLGDAGAAGECRRAARRFLSLHAGPRGGGTGGLSLLLRAGRCAAGALVTPGRGGAARFACPTLAAAGRAALLRTGEGAVLRCSRQQQHFFLGRDRRPRAAPVRQQSGGVVWAVRQGPGCRRASRALRASTSHWVESCCFSAVALGLPLMLDGPHHRVTIL